MSEKASAKTLHRLTFQEVVKLRELTDGIHNPYVYAKWIPEKDVEGLVAALKKPQLSKTEAELKIEKLKLQPPMVCMTSDFQFGFLHGFQLGYEISNEEVLVLMDVKEQKEHLRK